eukprot:TRINITY_DN16181_c0_g1_i1.p1 TRINITY_DN16181_c0_g1~~TRINITY_DN16181_c0_g1_i1.p1  ORF type:complete len:125 (-),score=24.36 TRINITY_DN16181_c0_g1_i1:44-418(-)
MMERWETRRMFQEERSQRQAILHELARQCRLEAKERRAMQRADDKTIQRSLLRRRRRDEVRLRRVVALWQQQQARQRAQAAEAAARSQVRSARDARRREETKRAERWKRMNRRDITMAELLAGQ